jgi:hypothetical protein
MGVNVWECIDGCFWVFCVCFVCFVCFSSCFRLFVFVPPIKWFFNWRSLFACTLDVFGIRRACVCLEAIGELGGFGVCGECDDCGELVNAVILRFGECDECDDCGELTNAVI